MVRGFSVASVSCVSMAKLGKFSGTGNAASWFLWYGTLFELRKGKGGSCLDQISEI